MGMDMEMLKRPVNVGFSGGEKKRNEMVQMGIIDPRLAILDETDSGLDIDALRTVGDGIKPQSHAADPALADRYEEYFAEKSRRIDITNRFSFAQAQQIC